MTSTERKDASVDGQEDAQGLLSLRDLFATMAAISSMTQLDDLLPHLARFMAGSVGAQRCSVYLYNTDLSGVTNHYRWGYTATDLAVLDQVDLLVSPMEIPAERHVIATREILQRIVGEVDPDLLPINPRWHETGWRGDMVVPIIWNDRVEGVAMIHLPAGSERFDSMQVEIARGVAHQAAGVINHLRTVESERRARRQTEMLLESSRDFNTAASTTEIYAALAESVRDMLGTDAVSIVVQDLPHEADGRPSIRRVAAVGLLDDEVQVRDSILERHSVLESTIDRIAGARHDPLILNLLDDVVDDAELRVSFHRHGVSEVLAAPIEVGGMLHGVVYSWSRQGAVALDPESLPIIGTMVRHAAASIERVRLVEMERVQRERAESLLSFSRLLNLSADLAGVTGSIVTTLERELPGARIHIRLNDRSLPDFAPGSALDVSSELDSLLDSMRRDGVAATMVGDTAIVVMPLTVGLDDLGAIVISRDGGRALTDEEHALLSGLVPQAAGAIRRALLYDVAERHVAELTLLQEVGRAILVLKSMSEMFDYIADEICKVVDYTAGIIALESQVDGMLQAVSVWGTVPPERIGDRIPIESSVMGQAFTSSEPIMVDDIELHPGIWGRDAAVWRSMMCVPMMSGSRPIGVMLLGHEQPNAFTTEDMRLASLLAGQAGAAIYQARESERQRSLYRAGVEALAAAVDAKDSFVHSHSRQVADFARRTAEALGLSPEEVERIELAGLLHDVGKIGIPDHILTKPGRLNPQERLIMIDHATLGARIVAAHPSLARLSSLVLHHHEWHNGSGYPDGLRGDEIPLGAAIIAVADAFDSMTSYRPYRTPLSYEAAREEIASWSGTQFHPAVVEAFLAVLDSDPPALTGNLTDPAMKLEPIQALDFVAPKVLSQIATEISQLTNLYPFLHRVQEIICEELRYDDVHIFLVNESDGQLVLAASTANAELVSRYRIAPGEGLTGHAILHRQVINCGDITADPRAMHTDLATRSLLIVPLVVDDQVIGVLGTGSAEPDRFEDRDVTLMMAIAGQIAPTIRVAQLHDHAKRAATIDGLTGVLNHRGFYQRLEEMISQLDRWDDDLHLLIVDVIGLKAVNDIHGHLAGDRALKAIAAALKSRVRDGDDVARYGGDEFVVIVRGTPRGGLSELVERVVAPVEFILDDGTQMTIRLRSGVATADSPSERAAELVARADAGLYSHISPTVRDDGY